MAFHQNILFAADFLEYPQQHCGYYKYLSVMIQRYCPLTNQFESLYVFLLPPYALGRGTVIETQNLTSYNKETGTGQTQVPVS